MAEMRGKVSVFWEYMFSWMFPDDAGLTSLSEVGRRLMKTRLY